MAVNSKGEKVKFIRVRGRVVPIKAKDSKAGPKGGKGRFNKSLGVATGLGPKSASKKTPKKPKPRFTKVRRQKFKLKSSRPRSGGFKQIGKGQYSLGVATGLMDDFKGAVNNPASKAAGRKIRMQGLKRALFIGGAVGLVAAARAKKKKKKKR